MEREEAINKIRNFIGQLTKGCQDAIRVAIPELEVSEDERTINELQYFLSTYGSDFFGTGKWQKYDDWLENQKEKVVEFDHLKEENPLDDERFLKGFDTGREVQKIFDEQKPADCSSCSKSLEGYINGRSDAEIKLLNDYGIVIMPDGELRMEPRQKPAEWREEDEKMRNALWKPSEEQMYALATVANDEVKSSIGKNLRSLYNDLKKL